MQIAAANNAARKIFNLPELLLLEDKRLFESFFMVLPALRIICSTSNLAYELSLTAAYNAYSGCNLSKKNAQRYTDEECYEGKR
jgi:hypothetical protein